MLNDNISACETKIAPKIVKVPPVHMHTQKVKHALIKRTMQLTLNLNQIKDCIEFGDCHKKQVLKQNKSGERRF